MHPIFPTAELSIVVSSFEIQFGLKAIENIMRIQNAIVEQFDTREDKIFEQTKQSQALEHLRGMDENKLLSLMREKS
jgi:conjugal transfer/entry exclusion protein